MPRRNKDNLGKILPNTTTSSHNQPFLFFGGCDQEEPLGEQPDIFEEPIGEEEEESIMKTMKGMSLPIEGSKQHLTILFLEVNKNKE